MYIAYVVTLYLRRRQKKRDHHRLLLCYMSPQTVYNYIYVTDSYNNLLIKKQQILKTNVFSRSYQCFPKHAALHCHEVITLARAYSTLKSPRCTHTRSCARTVQQMLTDHKYGYNDTVSERYLTKNYICWVYIISMTISE